MAIVLQVSSGGIWPAKELWSALGAIRDHSVNHAIGIGAFGMFPLGTLHCMSDERQPCKRKKTTGLTFTGDSRPVEFMAANGGDSEQLHPMRSFRRKRIQQFTLQLDKHHEFVGNYVGMYVYSLIPCLLRLDTKIKAMLTLSPLRALPCFINPFALITSHVVTSFLLTLHGPMEKSILVSLLLYPIACHQLTTAIPLPLRDPPSETLPKATPE